MSVRDPKNLPPNFIQRLKCVLDHPSCAKSHLLTVESRDTVERPSRNVLSHAVDLDQVAERLQGLPAETDLFVRSPSTATTEPLPSQEEQDLECLREEIESYNELVDAGGRPPCPRSLLEELLWTPEHFLQDEGYRDIILFWRFHSTDRVNFCKCHLLRWTRFRRLQRTIRRYTVKRERVSISASYFDTWEDFLDHPASENWSGQWGFHEYAVNMKARFLKYGFSRSFTLEQDLDQQDKLTTWIEYLGYEYYFYDQAVNFVGRFQQRHDNAWQKLVDSDLLRPEETYEVICDVATAFKHENERQQAERTAPFTATGFERRQGEALSRSNLAEDKLGIIRARNEVISTFLQTTREYRGQKDEAERHSLLLRWIVKQMPYIERGVYQRRNLRGSQTKLKLVRNEDHDKARNPCSVPTSLGRNSNKRNRIEMTDNGRPLKRVKSCDEDGGVEISTPDASARAKVTPSTYSLTAPELKGSGFSAFDPPQLRRSARLAGKTKKAAMSDPGGTESSASSCIKYSRT